MKADRVRHVIVPFDTTGLCLPSRSTSGKQSAERRRSVPKTSSVTATLNRTVPSVPRPTRLSSTWDGQHVRFATPAEADVVRLARQRAAELAAAADGELRDLCQALRDSVARRGGNLSAAEQQAQQVAGAALVFEAVRRTRGWKMHNEQLLTGLILAKGRVAEMADGEGKTLSAAIPALIGFLDDEPVHIATANAARAVRDYRRVSPVLERLGLSVSLLPRGTDLDSKSSAYQADVVYGAAEEFGRDHLRECGRSKDWVRRGVMIVDDCDTVLIDEASTLLTLDAANAPAAHRLRIGHDVVLRRDPAHELLPHDGASSTRISRQRFFRQYPKLCGMTGTVIGSEAEFAAVYGLKSVVVQRRRKCRRVELPDRYFATGDDKLTAIVHDIWSRQRTGQPVFAGAAADHELPVLSDRLRGLQISHQVLTGKQPSREARLAADAGRFGAVTLAATQAGQGTSIRLDERSSQVGGLYVIGVNRQRSRRLDRQLANLAGQRSEFGFCRFFISADDELLDQQARSLARRIQQTAGSDGEVHDQCDLLIQQVQLATEQLAMARRQELVAADGWLDDVLTSLSPSCNRL